MMTVIIIIVITITITMITTSGSYGRGRMTGQSVDSSSVATSDDEYVGSVVS